VLREWPLVAFTIAAQLAVGLFLFMVAPVPWLLPTRGEVPPSLPALLVILALLTAAGLVSFFHLHHLLRAGHVLRNLKSSWLSREILAELGFGALVVLLAVAAALHPATSAHERVLAGLAALAGLALVLCMARLYMLPAVAAWRSATTPLAFLLTTLTLGALGAAAATGRPGSPPPAALLVLPLALQVATLLAAIVLAPGNGFLGAGPAPSLKRPPGGNLALHLTRLALLSLGSAALISVVVSGDGGRVLGGGASAALSAALLLTLAGEVLGRFQFYSQHARS
jgi:anaerobic dimethyl sulfoxide reductase subunit C